MDILEGWSFSGFSLYRLFHSFAQLQDVCKKRSHFVIVQQAPFYFYVFGSFEIQEYLLNGIIYKY